MEGRSVMSNSQEALLTEPLARRTGYRDFAIIVSLMGIFRAFLPFIPVPVALAPLADFALLIGVFIATIYAIYRAMSEEPKPHVALIFFLLGALLLAGGNAITELVFHEKGAGAVIFSVISQTGLLIGCIGLGALIASLLREKNILIPVAIFLVGFDIFLVLTPYGVTQKLMKANPNILSKIAMSIPKTTSVISDASSVTVAKAALVGPADLVFLGAFFLAMYRFKMRPRETLKIMIPTLIGYMTFVILTGWNLPALVPIGLVTLFVNYREFNLNKEEKTSTAVLAVIVLAILGFSATRKPALQPAPSPSDVSANNPESANLPETKPPTKLPSSAPSDEPGKPDPL